MLKAELKTISEEELVRGCSDGKEQSYRLLYEKYYGRMLNVCRRYAKDHDEAHDMLQEGFIRVFKSIRQYKSEGSFEGWLRRVVISTCINYYHKYNRKDAIDYVEHMELTFSDSEEKNNYDSGINPTISSYDSAYLLKLIQNLPASYRMVFNLHAIEGYSHTEIAGKLKITESTSRSNLAKARQKLQQMIKPHEIQKNITHG